MKILLIEDNIEMLNFFKHILIDAGNNVDLATNQTEFVDYLDDNKIHTYDIIICDHNYPYFADESKTGPNGLDAFFELFHEQYKGIFIHFSYDPCPDEYTLKDQENCLMTFKSIKKRMDGGSASELLEFIQTIKL